MNPERPMETNGRDTIADTMNEASERGREYGQRMEGKLGRVAQQATDRMNAAADYVRSHDMNEMWNDAARFLRRYPAESLAAALVLGVLVGRSMRRD